MNNQERLIKVITLAGLDPGSLAAIQSVLQLGYGIDAYLLCEFQESLDRAIDLGFLVIKDDKVYPTKQCQQLLQSINNIRAAH